MAMTLKQAVVDDDALDVMLACRPVYSKNQDLAAFQLLLQGGGDSVTLSDIESSHPVILGTYSQVYQDGRTRTVPTFLRVTPEVLLARSLPHLPKKQYILDLDHGLAAPGVLLEQARRWAGQGYRLALDGFGPADSVDPALLDLVHIIKLDVRRFDDDTLRATVEKLRPHGADLLADHLDDRRRFRVCLELGFSYYQGDFLSTAVPVKGRKIAGNQLLLLRLLAELHNPESTPSSLEAIAIQDAHLTWRILRVVNSAALGLRREVSSLSQAIALLGMDEMRRWANLLLVHGSQNKPAHLVRNMLVRGRMCEVLAELSGEEVPVNHFIVGLLSQLDVITDIAMPELMDQVPLSQEVKRALVAREGKLGDLLNEVEHYENGRFDRLTWLNDTSFYEVAYRHSVAWARQIQQALGSL